MAILYGTQSNGETLPVLVDQFGNLLAKGIEGARGEPGPPGPPGIGELPPGASDGALLGWQDGELVWITEPLPPLIEPFIPVIYDGNSGTQSISCGFSPALVWIKSRNTENSHQLFDSVRGPNQRLKSDSTAESSDQVNSVSFDNSGFTLGNNSNVNISDEAYVSYCWDAGDTTVTNNDGSISSQVRSNGSFSVVKYTGTQSPETIGIGLNTAPKLVLVKRITSGASWAVNHVALGGNSLLELNTSGSVINTPKAWNNTIPTGSLLSVGDFPDTNEDSESYIAYCWAEVSGESSFGEYTGISTSLTVQCGFKPSLVIIKSTGAGNWFMFDNARGTSRTLYSNLSNPEEETGVMQFLDNGFQLLFDLPGVNESSQTYIYAAFANPEDAAFAQRQMRRQGRQEERQQNETRLR